MAMRFMVTRAAKLCTMGVLAMACAAGWPATVVAAEGLVPWEPAPGTACEALTPWQALWTAPAPERRAWAQSVGSAPNAQQADWLVTLAWDDDLEVRMAAQAAVGSPCARGASDACVAWLGAFDEHRDAPGVWRARVALLHAPGVQPDPETLVQPPLELVARLSALTAHGPAAPMARAALRLLAEAPDPELQEAAAAALGAAGD